MAEEGYSKSLDFMIDIHSNIEQLAALFQSRGGEMVSALNSLEVSAQRVGKSFSDIMQMQMATSLRNIEKATTTMAVQMTPLFDSMNDTVLILSKSIAILAKTMTKTLGKAAESVQDDLEDLFKSIEKQEEALKKRKKELEANAQQTEEYGDSLEKVTKVQQDYQESGSKMYDNLKGTVTKIANMRVVKDLRAMSVETYGNIKNFHDLGKAAMTSFKGMWDILQTLGKKVIKTIDGIAKMIAAKLGIVGIVLYDSIKTAILATIDVLKYFTKQFIAYMNTLISVVKGVGRALFNIYKGPLMLLIKGVKWLGSIIGSLSFADAVKSMMALDTAANDMARTMIGSVASAAQFGRAYNKLMSDMFESAWKVKASVDDIITAYRGLASMHIPLGELKGLAETAYTAAKGLGLGVEQATQLVATLRHVGRLGKSQIKTLLGYFAILQQNIGLSAEETQALSNAITDFAKRVSRGRRTSEVINSYAKAASKLSAVFIKAGIDAQQAAEQMQKLFDPTQLENNIALYGQLGMSISDVMNIMQGNEKIPEDMAKRFVELSKRIVSMGPIAGKAYAEAMGLSYNMAQQLASVTGDVVTEVNKMFGKGVDEQAKLEEQMARQEEQLARKLEIARNRMALNMMETMRPILGQLKGFMDFINKVITAMRPIFQAIGQLFSQLLQGADKLVAPLTQIVNSFVSFFTSAKSGVFDTIVGIVQDIAGIIKDIMPDVQQIVIMLGKSVGTLIRDLLGGIKSIMPNIKPIIKVLTDIFGVILKNIIDIVDMLINTLFPKTEKGMGGIASILNVIADGLRMFGNIINQLMTSLKGPLSEVFKIVNDVLVMMQEPLKQFFMSVTHAFGRFAGVLKTLAERLTVFLKTIDWKKLMDALVRFFEHKLTKMINRLESFTNNVLTERNMRRAGGLVNLFIKLFNLWTKLSIKLSNFFEIVTAPFKWLIKVLSEVQWDWKHPLKSFQAAAQKMKEAGGEIRQTTVSHIFYNYLEAGQYEAAAKKLQSWAESRKNRELARDLASQLGISMHQLMGLSPEELAKKLRKQMELNLGSIELGAGMEIGAKTEEAPQKPKPYTTTLQAYREPEQLTTQTFKGMTDKQADDLLTQQKQANRIMEDLLSSISLLNENIANLSTDMQIIKREVLQIEKNTARI